MNKKAASQHACPACNISKGKRIPIAYDLAMRNSIFCHSARRTAPSPGAKFTLRLVLVVSLVTGTLWAANDPFVGKWKLDPSHSKFIDMMKVAAAGANRYSFSFSPGYVETVVADGSDHPALDGTTLAITIVGPDSWKVVRKQNGRTTIIGIWKLSQDGKTLTDTFTGFKPDGSTFVLHYVYQRTAGSSGFPGTWESPSGESPFALQIEPYQGDGLSFIAEGVTKNIKFDGKDYPNLGRTLLPGSASSGRRVNGRSLEITDKIKGKVTHTQDVDLSPDLKTLTATVHPAGQSKPNILVFNRE
jgi:hypothetical protein